MTLICALALALAVYGACRLATGRRIWTPGTSSPGIRPSRLRTGLGASGGAWTADGAVPGSRTWLVQAGAPISSAQFAAACTASASAGAAMTWVAVHVPVLAAAGGVAGAALPVGYWSTRRARLRTERAGAWPDAVRYLVGALGSGVATLHEGLEELSRSGPTVLRPVFSRYARLSGRVGDRRALQIVRAELADPVADPVLIALEGAVDEGTGTALRALADIGSQITADLQLAERARTAQSQSRMAAWGCFTVPYAVLAFLCATNSTYGAYFSSPAGTFLVLGGMCLSISGLAVCLRLARPVQVRRRVFTGTGRA